MFFGSVQEVKYRDDDIRGKTKKFLPKDGLGIHPSLPLSGGHCSSERLTRLEEEASLGQDALAHCMDDIRKAGNKQIEMVTEWMS